MKHSALTKSLLATLLFGSYLPALAHDEALLDAAEGEAACEQNIKLPSGYQFTEFTNDCQYNENLTPVVNDEQFGFSDNKGNIIIKPQFEMAYGFDEGVALVKQNGKYGYITPNGKFAIKPQFSDAWGFWEGRAKVIINKKVGFIDKTGKTIIAPTFDDSGNWFEDGLVAVKKENKWGFIDTVGKTKISFKYDSAEDFSEGYAVVGKATKEIDEYDNPVLIYGYIDTKGKQVIPYKYSYASPFEQGVATVIDNDEYQLIDYQGNVIE